MKIPAGILRMRALTLLALIASFYLLTSDGGRGWVALLILLGLGVVTSFASVRWACGESWGDSASIALVGVPLFFGMYPYAMNAEETKTDDSPDWVNMLLASSLAEATFFVCALSGMWAVTAVIIALFVLAVQSGVFMVFGNSEPEPYR